MFNMKGKIGCEIDSEDGPTVAWVDVNLITFTDDDGTYLEAIGELMETLVTPGGYMDEALSDKWNTIEEKKEYNFEINGSLKNWDYKIVFS